FTEKAIKAIMLAQEEGRRLGHNFVGTEQILLGLIGEGTGVAAKVLRSMGVKLKDARLEVEKIIGRGSGYVGAEIPFTPRAKRVLELSLEEAQQLEHSYVGTEHLLLGLIRQGEGVAVRVLENLGVDLSKVRTQVIQMLDEIAEVEVDISQKSEKIFERFAEKAIKAILLAQEEARRLGHNFVGTEQILLGLIGEGTGVAAKVLKSMGVNLKDARIEVEKIIGRGSGDVKAEIPFTPRAKRVLELSLEEAQQLGHDYVGIEHLLLGLIREGEGVAARVLKNLGVDLSNETNTLLFDDIEQLKTFIKNNIKEELKTISEEVEKSSSETDIDAQNYLKFLGEVLEATGESNGDSKVIYPLLQQNLDKLDNNFADILRSWATAKFSEVEADVAEYIALCIGHFSYLIRQFPLGSKANNMEISIAGYEQALQVHTQTDFPIKWAATQNNLGAAYSDRIRGNKAQNIEAAIAACQQALLVYTQTDFPIDWAATQNNLGNAY
ncbi:MAG: tetratricopeptide repeat protein, partial [Trichodesmium sp. St18_bin1]|nr:tetratricopeptide repeat protein [Trichodesmium sp. St18_bin1]